MFANHISRRAMLRQCSLGFGGLALTGLLADKSYGALSQDARPPGPNFKPRAKRVVFCYMSGGVSHVDSFDPKPELAKRHGQPMPVPVRPTMFNNNGNIMGSPWEFKDTANAACRSANCFLMSRSMRIVSR